MLAGEGRPLRQALGLHFAAHQLVAQLDGRVLALLLVADADLGALLVAHQRQAERGGKCAVRKLRRSAHVHHRCGV